MTTSPDTMGLEEWRYEELLRAGYPPDWADVLAAIPEVDLHQAVQLLANGCTVTLAIRILT